MKQELIFLGPPACGKGTQTNRLSEYLGFPHIDTGSLLRAEIAKETEDGNRIYQEMEFYRNMASKYGLKLLMTECEEIPGDIIYEDDYQIAVINQKKDLKTRVTSVC